MSKAQVPATKATTQLPQVAKTALLPSELMDEVMSDAAEFRETMTKDDIAIPFLAILQALSPQCMEEDPQYVEGARPGMLYNSVSREVYDGKTEGLRLVPVAYRSSYIEWVPRSAGGGFVREWDAADGGSIGTVRNDNNQDIIQHGSALGTPGNQLVFTHTHYVFIVRDDGSYEPAVLTMSSTQVKHSRRWNFLISSVKIPGTTHTAPRFLSVWRLTTQHNKNDSGSWYTAAFAPEGFVTALPGGTEIYQAAKEFAKGVASGEKKVSHEAAVEANPTVNVTAAKTVF
jgi:hypothetical protein